MPSNQKKIASLLMEYYRYRPAKFLKAFLGLVLSPHQEMITDTITKRKKTLLLGGHSVGKSYLLAGLSIWWHITRNPSMALLTAPSSASVHQILFAYIRTMANGMLSGLMPSSDVVLDSPNHAMYGITASSPEAFQGRKSENMLIIFDECIDIPDAYWDAADGMLTSDDSRWIAACNPTKAGSLPGMLARNPDWNVISLSCLEHPNVIAELKGGKPPIPGAVRLAWVEDKIRNWCSVSSRENQEAFEWPPGSGIFYKPDDRFLARVMGKFPSGALNAVWQPLLLEQAFSRPYTFNERDRRWCLGVDVARYGSDATVIAVRHADAIVQIYEFSSAPLDVTLDKIKRALEDIRAKTGVAPGIIPIAVDDDGLGGGLTDFANRSGLQAIPVRVLHNARNQIYYPNRRCELWFDTAENKNISFAALGQEIQQEIRRQAQAAFWETDSKGRREVSSKDEMRSRLGRSPDILDAINLAFSIDHAASIAAPSATTTMKNYVSPRTPYTPNYSGIFN